MNLVEREDVLDQLEALLSSARQGNGRAALIRGEAGIGKTSVVRAFGDRHLDDAHVLWGGCDDLLTPQPLGPIWDMALDEPGLAEVLRGPDRHQVFAKVLDLMSRSLRPTLVVIEDIHWADESTLDLIKFLSRRVDRTHSLLVLTYREGEVPGDRPLRESLGDVTGAVLGRIDLKPLSRAAVDQLSGQRGAGVWEISGGNPFFVTELIASEKGAIPVSVRDAVTARVGRLSAGARSLVDLVSVVPSRAELDLVDSVLAPTPEVIAEAEEAGVLELRDGALTFRHELARRSIEADLPLIRRRELNIAVLRAIESLGFDVARAAHHARAGGDIEALIRLAPEAARKAAGLESHTEAVAHLRALEPYLDHLTPEQYADHLTSWAYEEYLINEITRAYDLAGQAITAQTRLGDPLRCGRTLLIASRIAWVHNRRATAVEWANQAAEVLEAIGGEPLANAYSTMSQLAMLASDKERALLYGEMALAEVGEGPSQVRAHALNNIGSVMAIARYPEGVSELEASYFMAADLKLPHEQIRSGVNLAWSALYARDLVNARVWIDRAETMASNLEITSFEAYGKAEHALLDEMAGNWVEAEATARLVLEEFAELGTAEIVASSLLGKLLARQGHADAKYYLLRGWELAVQADEIQRTGPAGATLAEYLWLGGTLDRSIIPRLRDALAECFERDSPWLGGELAFWLYLGGHIEEYPDQGADPYRWAAGGQWEKAAELWKERGIPYDRAIALSLGDNHAKVEALTILEDLGAAVVAGRLRSQLMADGVTGLPRGPIRATRSNKVGLTPRQMDVLELLAGDLTNAEIADRLFLSTRTVDHHVSAILLKLAARSRSDAVSAAQKAGVLP